MNQKCCFTCLWSELDFGTIVCSIWEDVTYFDRCCEEWKPGERFSET